MMMMMMMIQTMRNKLLIKPDAPEVKTQSGLFLPPTRKNIDFQIGTVVACGCDVKPYLEVGTRVICNIHSPIITDGHEEYIYCREDEIAAFWTEEASSSS